MIGRKWKKDKREIEKRKEGKTKERLMDDRQW